MDTTYLQSLYDLPHDKKVEAIAADMKLSGATEGLLAHNLALALANSTNAGGSQQVFHAREALERQVLFRLRLGQP